MKQKASVTRGSKTSKAVASLALAFASAGANSACCFIYHQPEKPDLKKIRKY